MKGQELLETLVQATGLPESPLHKELNHLIGESKMNSSDIDLEQLRTLLAEYAQDVLLRAKKTY